MASSNYTDVLPTLPKSAVIKEVEEGFISKLRDLKDTDRSHIRDRAALEQNFREKFESLKRVNLTDGEFARLLDEIITPDVFTAAKILRAMNGKSTYKKQLQPLRAHARKLQNLRSAHSVRRVGTCQQSDVATTQGVPITLALVVAASLCWGVIVAKPPRIALLRLSKMRPAPERQTHRLRRVPQLPVRGEPQSHQGVLP